MLRLVSRVMTWALINAREALASRLASISTIPRSRVLPALLLVLPGLGLAQTPPELPGIASILGGVVDAEVYAGARLDDGPYLSTVELSSDFQVHFQVDPVPEAIGNSGK